MITAHSLHKINIVFVPAVPSGHRPENSVFGTLFTGDDASGMTFVDDPVIGAQSLTVPKLGLQVAWESGRLRVEDMMQREPEESFLPKIALHALATLAPGASVSGFGFNYHVYYHSTEVLPVQGYFSAISPRGLELGESVLDFGWQWTTAHKNGEELDGYFLKVSAPLELVVLHNAHFNRKMIPTAEALRDLFRDRYEATHRAVKSLNLQSPHVDSH